jgi:ribA/ribD-fused uncharacterized protein
MIKPITSFTGKYRFLSNFYPSRIMTVFPTVEHAYQAAKCVDMDEFNDIMMAETPGKAKKLGAKVNLREDWEEVKLDVMFGLVRAKFIHYSELQDMLLETGKAELIEGNRWGDTYWGQCPLGSGFNHLGRILMEVREEIAKSIEQAPGPNS